MSGPPPGSARRDPFAALGLDAAGGLTDDEVRAAWRRIATATHPDLADGGDPDRYAAAAAAYNELRTRYGRGEALAALGKQADPAGGSGLARLPARVARGRPLRLALRAGGAVAVAWAALGSDAPHGAGPAVAAGAATWLILTGRADLAP